MKKVISFVDRYVLTEDGNVFVYAGGRFHKLQRVRDMRGNEYVSLWIDGKQLTVEVDNLIEAAFGCVEDDE